MRLATRASIFVAMLAASLAFAQTPNGPQHPQGNAHTPAPQPNYTMHPGARGFVQRPA